MEYIIKNKIHLPSLIAIIFPCAIIFGDDNPIGGLVALAMQATAILWIPASMWAWKIVHRGTAEKPSTAEKPKTAPKKPRPPSPKEKK